MRKPWIICIICALVAALSLCISVAAAPPSEEAQPTSVPDETFPPTTPEETLPQPSVPDETTAAPLPPEGDDDTDATQHVCRYEPTVTKPTCTQQGYTTYTCACGNSYVDDCVAALGHSYGTWTQTITPTCTKDGERVHACARCGHSETQVLSALGHDYRHVVTEPTCTESGFTTHTCTRCSHTYTDQIVPRREHAYGDWKVEKAATCTADGRKLRVCADCGSFENEIIPATGHEMGQWYVSKTTASGNLLRRRDCEHCDYYEEIEDSSTHRHDYTATVTAPTCTQKGYTTYRCNACGHTYTDAEKQPLGHSYGAWYIQKESTTTADGVERRDCTRCDHYQTRSIPATGETTVPTVPPTEPTVPPTDAPTEPTVPPTDAPADPTLPPTEPTSPTTQPTLPPTEPTSPVETPANGDDPDLRIVWIVIGSSAAVAVLTGIVLIAEALKKTRKRY